MMKKIEDNSLNKTMPLKRKTQLLNQQHQQNMIELMSKMSTTS